MCMPTTRPTLVSRKNSTTRTTGLKRTMVALCFRLGDQRANVQRWNGRVGLRMDEYEKERRIHTVFSFVESVLIVDAMAILGQRVACVGIIWAITMAGDLFEVFRVVGLCSGWGSWICGEGGMGILHRKVYLHITGPDQ